MLTWLLFLQTWQPSSLYLSIQIWQLLVPWYWSWPAASLASALIPPETQLLQLRFVCLSALILLKYTCTHAHYSLRCKQGKDAHMLTGSHVHICKVIRKHATRHYQRYGLTLHTLPTRTAFCLTDGTCQDAKTQPWGLASLKWLSARRRIGWVSERMTEWFFFHVAFRGLFLPATHSRAGGKHNNTNTHTTRSPESITLSRERIKKKWFGGNTQRHHFNKPFVKPEDSSSLCVNRQTVWLCSSLFFHIIGTEPGTFANICFLLVDSSLCTRFLCTYSAEQTNKPNLSQVLTHPERCFLLCFLIERLNFGAHFEFRSIPTDQSEVDQGFK